MQTYNYLYFVVFMMASSYVRANNEFEQGLFKALVSDKSERNVIYSPISIQSCLAMAYLGAKAETAEELSKALHLGSGDAQSVAKEYGEFLGKSFSNQQENGPLLKLANRVYVNEGLQINSNVKSLLQNNFKSDIEALPFAKSSESTAHINNWVEEYTNGQIKNLMGDGSVNADTSAILVNAIYFKGKWALPFSKLGTSNASFSVNLRTTKQVAMMFSEERFKYAELPQLDAKAIELPYENSDLSMLIILPNQVEGLKDLETKISNMDLNRDIMPKLETHKVETFLPRFKIEFETDLKEPLKQLGITKLFSNSANLSGFFDNAGPQKVSEMRHKAFLDVNEAGTEAAAASFVKMVLMSFNPSVKVFRADHPFVFAIRNNKTIFYAGHVVNI